MSHRTDGRMTSADRWGLAATVLLAVGAYAISVGHGFVYDDVHVIQANPDLHSIANWWEIVTSPWWGPELYRPLTSLTFAVDWTIGGGDPRVFHVTNIVLHAIAAALVYRLARSLLPALAATTAALFFAVHPVHVEAVANLVGRAEVLAGLFAVAAAIVYRSDGILAARGDRTWRRWLTSFGTLLLLWLALAAKESAFATAGILLMVDWVEAKRSGDHPLARFRCHWIVGVASVALIFEFLWLRTLVVGSVAGVHPVYGIEGEGLGARILVMAPVILEYARLLFVPLRLSADYSPNFFEPVAAVTVNGVTGVALLLLAILIAVRVKDRSPELTFALAWIGGTLLVVSNLIVPSGVILAERSMYLPSVGAALILGWLALRAVERWRTAAVAGTAVIVGAGMVRTILRVPVWQSDERLFSRIIEEAPRSYRSYWVASALAYGAGDRIRGEEYADRALAIQPSYPNLLEYMAKRYEEDQRWLEAGNALNRMFSIDSTRLPGAADAMVNYLRAGVLDSVVAVGQRARRIDPHHYQVLIAMSDLAMARGRPLEAMTWRRRVAWQFPDVWQYWHLTAEAAIQAGYCPEVERSIERVKTLQADLSDLATIAARAKERGCEPG